MFPESIDEVQEYISTPSEAEAPSPGLDTFWGHHVPAEGSRSRITDPTSIPSRSSREMTLSQKKLKESENAVPGPEDTTSSEENSRRIA